MTVYVQANHYPQGNTINLRFSFTSRPLQPSEFAAFLNGAGLPPGTGVDQAQVQADWWLNEGPITTISGASVFHDGLGEYRVQIINRDVGTYYYRGYSLDAGGNPVASSPPMQFVSEPV